VAIVTIVASLKKTHKNVHKKGLSCNMFLMWYYMFQEIILSRFYNFVLFKISLTSMKLRDI